MNRYEKLLQQWCDALVDLQIKNYGAPHDGAFLCRACTVLHGRADNAIFPMVYLYAKTRDVKYLDCAKLTLQFQGRLRRKDGAVYNDGQNFWKPITVFSAIGLYKTLHYFAEDLDRDFRECLKNRLHEMAEWVYDNLYIGVHTNINYYTAAASVLALCGGYFSCEKYRERSRKLLHYCMDCFTENGILYGEGQPHKEVTKKGCRAIDIGYNMEESMPCLIDAANALGEEEILARLVANAEKMLDFFLPDGGWDNSFGSRNNKWTYYGSRTSDGCVGAFMILGKYNPMFYEAAERNAKLLERCTARGLLHGGLQYVRLGQPPCVHHTFCHAAGLADALCLGLRENMGETMLPCDRTEGNVAFYPEADTYKIRIGQWLATITGYDYRTGTYVNGAAHASGGTLSMLYHREKGPVIAGSTYEYDLTEPLNMQQPMGDRAHRSLLPRLEYVVDGISYTTCIDPGSEIKVYAGKNRVEVEVRSHFVRVEDWVPEDENLMGYFHYTFSCDKMVLQVKVSGEKEGMQFILPIVEDTIRIATPCLYQHEKIYYLAGGLGADEYRFPAKDDICITLEE